MKKRAVTLMLCLLLAISWGSSASALNAMEPQVVNAYIADSFGQQVIVNFDQPMDPWTATNSYHYNIYGGSSPTYVNSVVMLSPTAVQLNLDPLNPARPGQSIYIEWVNGTNGHVMIPYHGSL